MAAKTEKKVKLPQTRNDLEITGTLIETDLETKVINGRDFYTGTVTAKVDNDLTIEASVFTITSYTKDGETKASPSYTSLKKLEDKNPGDLIHVKAKSGEIRLNEYYNAEERLVGFKQPSISFVETGKEEQDPKAAFTVEGYVEKFVTIGEDDNKAQLTILTVNYNGEVVPLTFDITSPEAFAYFEDVEEYTYVVVSGVITVEVNKVEKDPDEEMGFGSTQTSEEDYIRRIWDIRGGNKLDSPIEDEDELLETMAEAQKERAEALQLKLAKKKDKDSNSDTKDKDISGFGGSSENSSDNPFEDADFDF